MDVLWGLYSQFPVYFFRLAVSKIFVWVHCQNLVFQKVIVTEIHVIDGSFLVVLNLFIAGFPIVNGIVAQIH